MASLKRQRAANGELLSKTADSEVVLERATKRAVLAEGALDKAKLALKKKEIDNKTLKKRLGDERTASKARELKMNADFIDKVSQMNEQMRDCRADRRDSVGAKQVVEDQLIDALEDNMTMTKKANKASERMKNEKPLSGHANELVG